MQWKISYFEIKNTLHARKIKTRVRNLEYIWSKDDDECPILYAHASISQFQPGSYVTFDSQNIRLNKMIFWKYVYQFHRHLRCSI